MATTTGNQDVAGRTGGGTGPASHPAPARGEVGLGALWFGLFGAPGAWSVQLLVDYAVAAHTCFPRLYPLAIPTIGHGGLRATTVVVSVVFLAIGVLAGLTALRSWRATRHETGGHGHWALDTGEGRTRFMAMSGLITSAIFVIAMLVNTASALTVSPCW